jgi:hypothetical protein
MQNCSCCRIRVVCGGEIGSPRQETTRQQRELRVSESHKAAFELRIAAQIPCREPLEGFLPVSSQWSWFSANVRIRTAMSQPMRRTSRVTARRLLVWLKVLMFLKSGRPGPAERDC